MRAVGETKPVLAAAAAGLVANLGLNYPLYVFFGMAGPALASVIAQAVAIGILLMCIKRRLDVEHIFPVRPVAKTLGVAVLAGLPVYAIHRVVEGDLANLAIGFPCYLVIYLGLALWSGILSRSDLRYVLELVTGRLMKRAGQEGTR